MPTTAGRDSEAPKDERFSECVEKAGSRVLLAAGCVFAAMLCYLLAINGGGDRNVPGLLDFALRAKIPQFLGWVGLMVFAFYGYCCVLAALSATKLAWEHFSVDGGGTPAISYLLIPAIAVAVFAVAIYLLSEVAVDQNAGGAEIARLREDIARLSQAINALAN